jgi:hypothetical protein
MARTALADVQRDVADRYPPDEVSVVGIVVGVAGEAGQNMLAAARVKFPQLIDAQGTTIAQVGEGSLPRVYALDGERRIAWFDIEYSESTRRELLQTLAALKGEAEQP